MEQLQLESFCDSYIDEMIQAEIELERQAFYDNMSIQEKTYHDAVQEITKNLTEEIDREILNELFKIKLDSVERVNDTLQVNVIIQPVVESINLNLTISPEGVTFE